MKKREKMAKILKLSPFPVLVIVPMMKFQMLLMLKLLIG